MQRDRIFVGEEIRVRDLNGPRRDSDIVPICYVIGGT